MPPHGSRGLFQPGCPSEHQHVFCTQPFSLLRLFPYPFLGLLLKPVNCFFPHTTLSLLQAFRPLQPSRPGEPIDPEPDLGHDAYIFHSSSTDTNPRGSLQIPDSDDLSPPSSSCWPCSMGQPYPASGLLRHGLVLPELQIPGTLTAPVRKK